MMRRSLVIAIGVVFLAAGSARAHHSYGDYFTDQTVSIAGIVESIRYGNPHVLLTIRTADSQAYTAEWRSIPQLTHTGVTRTTLKAGDRIVVTGSPARGASIHKVTLLREIVRPSDGWRWARTMLTDPPR